MQIKNTILLDFRQLHFRQLQLILCSPTCAASSATLIRARLLRTTSELRRSAERMELPDRYSEMRAGPRMACTATSLSTGGDVEALERCLEAAQPRYMDNCRLHACIMHHACMRAIV